MKKLTQTLGAWPYFIAIFLNAFVDLGHKILIQNTVFKLYDGGEQIVLTAVVNALILIPFILLFSTAGFSADRWPKNVVMRYAAGAAVGLSIAITVCYFMGWFWLAFAMTFLLAVQSAFYSPAKFGYLKSLFGRERLASANGAAQAISIGAILAGTFLFSILFELRYPESAINALLESGAAGGVQADAHAAVMRAMAPLGFLLIIGSVVEWVLCMRLPTCENGDSKQTFEWKSHISGHETLTMLKPLRDRRVIRVTIIGLSMFWAIGQVLLAAFPSHAKAALGFDNVILVQGMLAAMGLGIGIGSTLLARWSKNYIESGVIPLAVAGMVVGLWLVTRLNSALELTLLFLWIGAMGGFFVVPLRALMQFHAADNEQGRIIAADNWLQNVAMLAFLILTALSALNGLEAVYLLHLIVLVAAVGGLYVLWQLPQTLARFFLTYLLSRHYRVNVQNVNRIPDSGGVLLLGNHISWIDWALIQICCPRHVLFVRPENSYERWYLQFYFRLAKSIYVNALEPSDDDVQAVADAVNSGKVVCLFPEGTTSRTGHIGVFRHDYERVCERLNDDTTVIPFYLRGLSGNSFARATDKLKRSRLQASLSRELIVAFGTPLEKDIPADILKRRVFDLSIASWESYLADLPTIPHAWISTAKRMRSDMAIADTLGEPLSGIKALTAAVCMSRRIRRISSEQNVGLLMPTSAGGVLVNMATLLNGKTTVNLNYSASNESVAGAIELADVKTVYTSKQFLLRLKQRNIDLTRALESVRVVYLEDVKADIAKSELVLTLLMVMLLPVGLLRPLICRATDANANAAILFSSGSEGVPKGIMLSHRNIMANLKQIAYVLNLNDTDVVMGSLPLFHAFGMTATQFLPLVEGLPMVCHADPTDAVGVGQAVAKYHATVICGTSTFLRLYTRNKKVHPLMFDSLRFVIAGAEKLGEEVRQSFQEKFNKPILEGYGATETTPVASVNLPDVLDTNYWHVQVGGKTGTVGMPLPGSSFKIVDPETFEELPSGSEGMIMIGGHQVMQGYLKNPEKTAEVIRAFDGTRWYVTGDKGWIDNDGFLTIVDRYSRFAKLGGEMVGLGEVEAQIRKLMDEEAELVAIAVPDPVKGEKIVLLSEVELDSLAIKKGMKENGCSSLMVPSQFFLVEAVPKLGSGKTDFASAKKMALELIA